MFRTFVSLLVALIAVGVGILAQATTISYNWDDGTLQGWAPIAGWAGDSTQAYGIANPTESTHPPYWTKPGDIGGLDTGMVAQSGTYFVTELPMPVGDYQDMSHHTTTLQSPSFVLGSGSITAYLAGGSGGSTWVSTLAAIPTSSSSGGMAGLALADASGNIVAHATVPTSGTTWQQVTITPAAQYIGQTMTLVMIDQNNGGWGWTNLDTVSIPTVPEPGTLALLAAGLVGLLCYAWRKRR